MNIRKALFIFIPAVFALSGMAYWWLVLRPLGSANRAKPEQAIPLDAAVVVYYPDMGATLVRYSGMPYFRLLEGIGAINGMSAVARGLDSLAKADSDFWELLDHRSIWMASIPREGDLAANFVALPVDGLSPNDLSTMLRRLVGDKAGISTQLVDDVMVYKVVGDRPYKMGYFALSNGLILACSDNTILRNSLQQLATGNDLTADPDFAKCIATAGQSVDAVVMINHPRLSDLLAVHMKASVMSLPPFNKPMATWTAIDVSMQNDGLGFSGFTQTGDSLYNYLDIFSEQAPQTIAFLGVMPTAISGFTMFGVNSMSRFYTDYRTHLQLSGGLADHDSSVARINRKYDLDIEIELFSWIESEFGVCVMASQDKDTLPENFAIFKTRSVNLAEESLSGLVLKLEQQRIKQETDSVSDVQIHRIGIANILPDLLGEVFSPFKETYYMVLGDHVVMGTSMLSMKHYARQVLAHRTYANDPSFNELAAKLSSKFNVFVYARPEGTRSIWESYINHKALLSMQGQEDLIHAFSATAVQMSSTPNGLYTAGHLFYGESSGSASDVWEAACEEVLINGPWGINNQLTQEPEILAQSEGNTLWLFDRFGQPIWSRKLDADVLGPVTQIAKGPKAGQLIVGTATAIYLVDREGKDVEGFPFKLSARATVAPTLVSYDAGKDLRIMVGCADGSVANLDLQGKAVQGWAFQGAGAAIDQPILHRVAAGNDHILVHDNQGRVHLLDRKGKDRMAITDRLALAENSGFAALMYADANKGGVFGTDSTGQLLRLNSQGKLSAKRFERFSAAHASLVTDLDTDGRPEFVFHDLNTIKVYADNGKLMWETRAATGPKPLSVIQGTSPFLAIANGENGTVELIDAKGNAVSGLKLFAAAECILLRNPESGQLAVSINKEGKLVIQHTK